MMCSFELEFTLNFSLLVVLYFKWILENSWSLFTIALNFLDLLVVDLCEPVLKD